MNDNWRPCGMVLWIWTWLGIRARLGLYLFRLFLVRSQTYYPEHILAYGSGKAHCALVVGSGSF